MPTLMWFISLFTLQLTRTLILSPGLKALLRSPEAVNNSTFSTSASPSPNDSLSVREGEVSSTAGVSALALISILAGAVGVD